MRIRFGDWELRKRDKDNWELFNYGVTSGRGSNMSDGKPRWRSTGRYYQFNTVHLAMKYAADYELRNDEDERSRTMGEYISELESKLNGFLADFTVSAANVLGH